MTTSELVSIDPNPLDHASLQASDPDIPRTDALEVAERKRLITILKACESHEIKQYAKPADGKGWWIAIRENTPHPATPDTPYQILGTLTYWRGQETGNETTRYVAFEPWWIVRDGMEQNLQQITIAYDGEDTFAVQGATERATFDGLSQLFNPNGTFITNPTAQLYLSPKREESNWIYSFNYTPSEFPLPTPSLVTP